MTKSCHQLKFKASAVIPFLTSLEHAFTISKISLHALVLWSIH